MAVGADAGAGRSPAWIDAVRAKAEMNVDV